MPAQAGVTSAPPLSPEKNTLYTHVNADDTANVIYFLSTLEEDGADSNYGTGGPGTSSSITWTFKLEPPISQDIILGDGSIEATAYVGASTGAGQVTLSTRILIDSTVLAEGEAKTHTFTPATTGVPSATYTMATWSMPITSTTIEAGQSLIWEIKATGTWSAIYLASSAARGRSNLVLPVESVGPPEVLPTENEPTNTTAEPPGESSTSSTSTPVSGTPTNSTTGGPTDSVGATSASDGASTSTSNGKKTPGLGAALACLAIVGAATSLRRRQS